MARRGASRAAFPAAALLFLVPRPAAAAPQWSTGIVAGVGGEGESLRWSRTKFYGALRGEALFARTGPTTVGFGPALEIGTLGFSDARFGAGATLLVPLDGVLAIGFTPGAYVRTASGGPDGGLSGRVFFGIHPSNRVGSYAIAGGLIAGIDQDVGASRSSAFIAAAQVDGLVLALPIILLVEWLRGAPD